MDLADIYKTFHPTAAEYTLFSSAHKTFSRIDQMLGHKTSLNKFKLLKSNQVTFPTTHGMKLEISKVGKLENSQILELEIGN